MLIVLHFGFSGTLIFSLKAKLFTLNKYHNRWHKTSLSYLLPEMFIKRLFQSIFKIDQGVLPYNVGIPVHFVCVTVCRTFYSICHLSSQNYFLFYFTLCIYVSANDHKFVILSYLPIFKQNSNFWCRLAAYISPFLRHCGSLSHPVRYRDTIV